MMHTSGHKGGAAVQFPFHRRDEQKFESLAQACEKQVYFTCLRMMRTPEDAMDAAQEAMLRAWRAFHTFRGDSMFSTWIDRIAVNTCLDLIRKRKATVSLDMLRDEGFDPADAHESTYGKLAEKERMALLKEGLNLLPDDMRTVLVLRDMEGRTMEEIASLLSLPLGTVKSRLNRARKKLCQFLSQNGELFDRTSV